MPIEDGMIADLENHVQIAGRTVVRAGLSLMRQAQPGAVIHTGRDVDLQLAVDLLVAFAMAHRAAFLDDLARAIALPAGSPDGEKALLIDDLAAAAAGGTGRAAAARLGALALAMLAGFESRGLDLGRHPEDGILKIDFQVVAQVFAPLRSVAPPPATAAEQVSQTEELAQDVA